MNSWPITAEEFTGRDNSASWWPFSAAMTLSLVLHSGAIIGAVLWMQPKPAEPSHQASTTTFDILLSRANATEDGGADQQVLIDSTADQEERVVFQSQPEQIQEQDRVEPEPNIESAGIASQQQSVESNQTTSQDTSTELSESPAHAEVEPLIVTAAESTLTVIQPLHEISEEESAVDLPQQDISSAELEPLLAKIEKWEDEFELIDKPMQETTWQVGDQLFQASLNRQAPQNNTDLERAIVTISTEVDGVPMATEIAFKRLAFSNYAQLIDRWDRDVSLSKDEIVGRFHSNTRLVVSPERRAEPKFDGKVTVASSIRLNGVRRRADVFLGGLQTRVTPIPLPKEIHQPLNQINNNSTETEGGFHEFLVDSQIEFVAGGGFYYSDNGSREFTSCLSPCFVVAGEGVVLGVKGVVTGTTIVSAAETIQITGDLTYANNPLENPESKDYLGLLSENYIEIASPDITGPGDITIQGALYAKRRFVVRRFRARNRGLLSVYGSLTAGSVSASEPRFATKVEFDNRFDQQRPPNFPMTNKYEMEDWNRQWTILR